MKHHQGFVRTIVIIIVALIILGYFGFDFRTIIESPQVRENLNYAWGLVKFGANYLWDWIVFAYTYVYDFVSRLWN